MAYVIAAPCIADYACVDLCPVQCIAPLPQDQAFDTTEQLYIDPARCIDCGACRDVCPVSAIFFEGDLPAQWSHYAAVNAQYFAQAAG